MFFSDAVFRKSKQRSIDSDSPGVSSAECSSIGSAEGNYNIDNIPPGNYVLFVCEISWYLSPRTSHMLRYFTCTTTALHTRF